MYQSDPCGACIGYAACLMVANEIARDDLAGLCFCSDLLGSGSLNLASAAEFGAWGPETVDSSIRMSALN